MPLYKAKPKAGTAYLQVRSYCTLVLHYNVLRIPFIKEATGTKLMCSFSLARRQWHIVTLVIKAGICHFEKQQIPLFNTKGVICLLLVLQIFQRHLIHEKWYKTDLCHIWRKSPVDICCPPSKHETFTHCWSNVDSGPTMGQQWVNVSYLAAHVY